MFDENRERQLPRAIPLIGPLEPPCGEALNIVVFIEPSTVHGDDQTVHGSLACKGAHGPLRTARGDISPLSLAAIALDPKARRGGAAARARAPPFFRALPSFRQEFTGAYTTAGTQDCTTGVSHVSPRPPFSLRAR